MPQDIADLVERRALAQHVCREAVPQQMRADVFVRRLEAGLLERGDKDRIEICASTNGRYGTLFDTNSVRDGPRLPLRR